MCAANAENDLKKLFGAKALYIEYTDPGYVLFKKVDDKIKEYRKAYAEEPQVIWLQNHGIFVAADTIEEIKVLYTHILDTLEKAVKVSVPAAPRATCSCTEQILPGIRMILSKDSLKTLKVRKNELVKYFYDTPANQAKIAKPFTPDAIVYCKSNYIFFNEEDPETVLAEVAKTIPAFTEKFSLSTQSDFDKRYRTGCCRR